MNAEPPELLQLSELSYGHGGCDEPLRGLTIGAALEHAARRYPDNEALVSVHQGLRYTYAHRRRGGRLRSWPVGAGRGPR